MKACNEIEKLGFFLALSYIAVGSSLAPDNSLKTKLIFPREKRKTCAVFLTSSFFIEGTLDEFLTGQL